jgi:heme exporter protein B
MAKSKSSWERTTPTNIALEPIRAGWWRQVGAIACKDVLIEWRTRHAVGTAIAFAVVSLTAASLSVGSLRDEPNLAAGVMWVILFFASCLALGRAFTKEEDAHTANLLRLTAEPSAIFAGKFLFNLLLLMLIALVTVPLLLAVMGVTVKVFSWLVIAVGVAMVAMAALGTMVGAMLAKAQSRTTLLGVAAFPLFFPALAAALQATAASFGAAPDAKDALRFLSAYAGASVLAGFVLFESVWSTPEK